MNPDEEIIYPKNQYKKYIKDVVSGTLERGELIEETIIKNLTKFLLERGSSTGQSSNKPISQTNTNERTPYRPIDT